MTPAELHLLKATARLQIATARLLLQVSGADRDVRLADLIAFAAVVGDETAADSVTAFRAAQTAKMHEAQAELNRLAG